MNYQPVILGNQSNPSAGFQDKFDAEKAEEEIKQQYVLFPMWSSGSINPQNTDRDVAFDEKKPEFEVNVSPSSSAQSKKHDDKTKKEAKGKSLGESLIGYRNLSAEFEDFSEYSINEVNAAELEDITHSDDEDDVGAEPDFNNLETSITVSPIPTARVHNDHPVTNYWQKGDILLVRIYIDDIIFGSTNKDLCKAFEKLIKDKFQMSSMGELTFFLGLQVKKKKDGIFISHDKYVAEIVRKFGLTDGKSDSTPIDTEKPLLKDPDGEDVDVHTYRSMIGSLMYLTSSRPDIMFAVVLSSMESLKRMVHVSNIVYQMVSGEDSSNPLMADNLPKIVWYSTHNVALMKSWLVQKQTALGVNTPRSDEDRLELMELTVFLLPCDEKVGVEFWTIVAVKKVNDVTRLQALVDKKEEEEIFAELARIGYEKPSTKLTFYKAFSSSQWKFLIHTILQCMSAKRTSWNEFSLSMASAVICLSSGRKFNFSKKQVGDLSTHTTKYTSPALTQKVFANMRRVGKGFSGVETPLFEGMVVAQEVVEGVADEMHDEGVHVVAGIVVEGDVSAANDEVPTADEEPSIPSLTPPTPPPKPSHDIPSTSQAQPTPPQSPQVAQAIEITKLKRRVKKLKRRNKVKVLKLRRLQKVGTGQRIDASDDTVMDGVSKQERVTTDMDADADVVLEEAKDVADDAKDGQDADDQENANIQGRTAKSQAEIYKINLDHANKVLSMYEEESEPVELQEVVDIVTTTKIITKVVTVASTTINAIDVPIPTATTTAALKLTAAPSKRRKGVVIRDLEESTTSTTSTIIHSEAKSKDKDWDEVINHVNKKEKKDKSVKRYQAMKRKPQTEAQARKNMIMYLKNVAGFKMDYIKGMSYDDIRAVFEKHFDLNVAFLQKTKDQIEEEESRALKRINETPAEKAAKRQKLDEEVEELKRHL
nr:hypothetical protein [Tanacetum cinerariifolium]